MTKISWCDASWNPIIGCSKKSTGCKNCYAEIMAKRLASMQQTKYYRNVLNSYRIIKDDPNAFEKWNGKTHFVESALEKPLQWKKPRMIFVCSMGDLFHESVPFEWIDKVFEVVENTPQHTYQLLTKRPEIMYEYMKRCGVDAPDNIWLGVTAENQEQANIRIPVLLQIPAKVRFVSIEPMLSEIKLYSLIDETEGVNGHFNVLKGYSCHESFNISKSPDIYNKINTIDWVICGGESGHNARPMHPDWVRCLKDQCINANVPFFFKQWGEWVDEFHAEAHDEYKINDCFIESTEYGNDYKGIYMYRIGKKLAGSLIDKKEYKQFPKLKK